MYAVQFEADIQDGLLRVPPMYREIYSSHAKVTIEVDNAAQKIDTPKHDALKKTKGLLAHLNIDPIAYQLSCRDDR